MTYLIIEHFHSGKIKDMYERFDKKGRMMPEGVVYINSWIDEEVKTCYQIMESESEDKLKEWIRNWDDLVDFEIIPVITSAQAKAKVLGNLNK